MIPNPGGAELRPAGVIFGKRVMPMEDRLQEVLEQKIRPTLRLHGGDIQVMGVEDGILRFRFLGHCSGCPSATLTTKQLVEEEICAALPEIKGVELVEEVGEELLAQARAILNHG